eukprot:ANDGO_04362.mRNA.1 hypothetical protein
MEDRVRKLLSSSAIVKCRRGCYLWKQGAHVKSWKRRFFVLDGVNKILYFETEESYRKGVGAKGVILLQDDCEIVLNVSDALSGSKHATFAFGLNATDGARGQHRTYFIDAGSDELRQQWQHSIMHVTGLYEKRYLFLDEKLHGFWKKGDLAGYEQCIDKEISEKPSDAFLRFKRAVMFLHPDASARFASRLVPTVSVFEEHPEADPLHMGVESLIQSVVAMKKRVMSSRFAVQGSLSSSGPVWGLCRDELVEALSRDPDFAVAHGLRGFVLFQEAENFSDPGSDVLRKSILLDDAKVAFECALALLPNEYHASLGSARMQMQEGNFAEAEKLLLKISRLYPSDPFILESLANLSVERSRNEDASRYFSEYIHCVVVSESSPSSPPISSRATLSEASKWRPEDDVEAFNNFLISPETFYRRGLAFAAQKDYASAHRDLGFTVQMMDALAQDPSSRDMMFASMPFATAMLQVSYDFACALFADNRHQDCINACSRFDWSSFRDRSSVVYMLKTSFRELKDMQNVHRMILWEVQQSWLEHPRPVPAAISHALSMVDDSGVLTAAGIDEDLILTFFCGDGRMCTLTTSIVAEAFVLSEQYDKALELNPRALDLFDRHRTRLQLRKWNRDFVETMVFQQQQAASSPVLRSVRTNIDVNAETENQMKGLFWWSPCEEIVQFMKFRHGMNSLEFRTWVFLFLSDKYRNSTDVDVDLFLPRDSVQMESQEWKGILLGLQAVQEFSKGNEDEGFSLLGTALDAVFHSFAPLLCLSALWNQQRGHLDKAEKDLRHAVKIDPSNLRAQLQLASLLIVTSVDADADAALEKSRLVLSAYPHSAEAHIIIATYHLRMKDFAGAADSYKLALRMEADIRTNWRQPDAVCIESIYRKLAEIQLASGQDASDMESAANEWGSLKRQWRLRRGSKKMPSYPAESPVSAQSNVPKP